jgi:hypothetical protein
MLRRRLEPQLEDVSEGAAEGPHAVAAE